jgi:hypothetical protein
MDRPLGCMYHSRRKSKSCSFAKKGSITAMGIMWKAESHEAYHGYSHLSWGSGGAMSTELTAGDEVLDASVQMTGIQTGMTIMSRLKRCCQSLFRPAWRI